MFTVVQACDARYFVCMYVYVQNHNKLSVLCLSDFPENGQPGRNMLETTVKK